MNTKKWEMGELVSTGFVEFSSHRLLVNTKHKQLWFIEDVFFDLYGIEWVYA